MKVYKIEVLTADKSKVLRSFKKSFNGLHGLQLATMFAEGEAIQGEFWRCESICELNWYTADTQNKSIILYGDIDGKRVFKITWKKDKYTAWKKHGKQFQIIHNYCNSLAEAQRKCVELS